MLKNLTQKYQIKFGSTYNFDIFSQLARSAKIAISAISLLSFSILTLTINEFVNNFLNIKLVKLHPPI